MKDKEKKIDNSWRTKMVENGIYKDSETTLKEKQIKEMANDMDYACTKRDLYPSDAKEIAKTLYLLDYQKVKKDSVVLSKKEWKEYQKFKAFMKRNDWESIDNIETTLDKCQEVLYERLQETNKKTVEKFYNTINYWILALNFETENKDYDEGFFDACKEILRRIDHVAKKFGIETKE